MNTSSGLRLRAVVTFAMSAALFCAAARGQTAAAPARRQPPAADQNTCIVHLADGTKLAGVLEAGSLQFKTRFGQVEVKTSEVAAFDGTALTLADQSTLQGKFLDGTLRLKSSRGILDLPLGEVRKIERPADRKTGTGAE